MQRIFAMLTADEHVTLMQRAGLAYYEPDTAIMSEGETSEAVYVIRSGQVRVETESSGFPLELSRLGPRPIQIRETERAYRIFADEVDRLLKRTPR
jgi:hypothetical protein